MLPKPEKIKKKIKSEKSESVNEISPQEKIRQKRRFIVWVLSLTIGLSFVFWIYHFFKNFSLPKISFSLPQITIPQNSASDISLVKDIDNLLASDKNTWSVYVKSDSFVFEKNSSDLSLNLTFKNNESSFIKKLLPSGAEVKENLISQDNSFEVQSLITIPNKKIVIIIKVSGNNLENSKKLIPLLAEKIYWDVISLP